MSASPILPRQVIGQRGNALLLGTAVMIVLVAIASLAVDYGRLQLARAELQAAADAGARSAAGSIAKGREAASTAAANVIDANAAGSRRVSFVPSEDLQLGNWNASSRAFTQLAPGANPATATAVKVTLRMTATRGTALPLMWGRILGVTDQEVEASSICATGSSSGSFGLFADQHISFYTGPNLVDSYDSTLGPYGSGNQGNQGHVGSNGDLNVSSGTSIKGDARSGPDDVVSNNGTVTGLASPLEQRRELPDVQIGSARTTNDNSRIPSAFRRNGGIRIRAGESLTLPGGTYFLSDLDLRSGGSLSFAGPATLYIDDEMEVSGPIHTHESLPKNLKIYLTRDCFWLDINARHHIFYMDVYGPTANVNLTCAEFYGMIVSKDMSISCTRVHVDVSLGGNGATRSTGVVLVK